MSTGKLKFPTSSKPASLFKLVSDMRGEFDSEKPENIKMKFSLDLNDSFLNNLRKHNHFESDTFTFCINKKEVILPLFEAISKSSAVLKTLFQDNTNRHLDINQACRSNITQVV